MSADVLEADRVEVVVTGWNLVRSFLPGGGHYKYVLAVAYGGEEWVVEHRYADFIALHKELCDFLRDPHTKQMATVLAPLPPKRPFADPSERAPVLNNFLRALASNPLVAGAAPFREFLQIPQRMETAISVSVTRAVQRGDHMEYEVVIAVEARRWSVLRRFSQFKALARDLANHYDKGTKLMRAFPAGKLFNNMRSDVVKTRRVGLDAFMREIARDRTLWQRASVQQFIRARHYLRPIDLDTDPSTIGGTGSGLSDMSSRGSPLGERSMSGGAASGGTAEWARVSKRTTLPAGYSVPAGFSAVTLRPLVAAARPVTAPAGGGSTHPSITQGEHARAPVAPSHGVPSGQSIQSADLLGLGTASLTNTNTARGATPVTPGGGARAPGPGPGGTPADPTRTSEGAASDAAAGSRISRPLPPLPPRKNTPVTGAMPAGALQRQTVAGPAGPSGGKPIMAMGGTPEGGTRTTLAVFPPGAMASLPTLPPPRLEPTATPLSVPSVDICAADNVSAVVLGPPRPDALTAGPPGPRAKLESPEGSTNIPGPNRRRAGSAPRPPTEIPAPPRLDTVPGGVQGLGISPPRAGLAGGMAPGPSAGSGGVRGLPETLRPGPPAVPMRPRTLSSASRDSPLSAGTPPAGTPPGAVPADGYVEFEDSPPGPPATLTGSPAMAHGLPPDFHETLFGRVDPAVLAGSTLLGDDGRSADGASSGSDEFYDCDENSDDEDIRPKGFKGYVATD